jgi:hypothetical protein
VVAAPDAVVDACCLINFAAAGDLFMLLTSSGFTWHLPKLVEAQGVQVRASADPNDRGRRTVDLDAVVRAGGIQRCDVTEGDYELFLEVAAEHGDDADAAALTIAEVQGWFLATDDRALKRSAARRGVQTVTTATVLKQAATATAMSLNEVAEMLRRVEDLGRWSPHQTDSDASWWHKHRSRA